MGKEISIMDVNSGFLWELSEIFNVIILNEKQFSDFLEMEEKLFYPNLKNKLEEVKKIWDKKDNLKDFIIESLGCLKKL